jgi:hypothetical protein
LYEKLKIGDKVKYENGICHVVGYEYNNGYRYILILRNKEIVKIGGSEKGHVEFLDESSPGKCKVKMSFEKAVKKAEKEDIGLRIIFIQ